MSCTDCISRNTCPSADKPMEEYIRSLPLETAHHRVETQKTINRKRNRVRAWPR